MRCPKCSFISFDDLATCAKCSNDLAIIAQELQGTCTEARIPFFLSSVVKAEEPEDQTFSGSQGLPPIDDTDINFGDSFADDDTSFSADSEQTLADFDESMELSDDDISLELGDIMPIDLDQLDEPVDLDDEINFDQTEILSLKTQEDVGFNDDIDLNLSGDFSDQNAESDATAVLPSDQFNDAPDLDLSGDFSSIDLDETLLSLEQTSDSIDFSPFDSSGAREALTPEDDLLASLTGEFPPLDSLESEEDELDASLLAELSSGFDDEDSLGEELPAVKGNELAEFELEDTDLGLDVFSGGESFNPVDTISEQNNLHLDEDLMASLTGEFPSLDNLDGLKAGPDEGQFDRDSAGDIDNDLAAFDLDASDLSPIPDVKAFGADDTLSEADISARNDSHLQERAEAYSGDEEQLGDELLATMDDDLDLVLAELDTGQDEQELSSEDFLIGEPESDDEDVSSETSALPSLGLEQIDVSDLLSTAPTGEFQPSSSDDEIDLASLMEEDVEKDDSDLDMLDDAIPEFEIIEDDDDDGGPPPLP